VNRGEDCVLERSLAGSAAATGRRFVCQKKAGRPVGRLARPDHSTGRALARLQLLILIHRPIGRLSEGVHQGEARSAVRRSRVHREEVQRSKPEAMPPDGYRSEGTPSLSEGPYVRGRALWSLWRSKVTRRKGGTISRHHRNNGYAPKTRIKRSQPLAAPTDHRSPTPCCSIAGKPPASTVMGVRFLCSFASRQVPTFFLPIQAVTVRTM